MKVIILTISILMVLISVAIGQLNYIPLNADFACYRGSENDTYIEFYFSFFQQELQYEPEDSLYISKFMHTLKIANKDSTILNTSRNYKNTITELKSKYNNKFIDVFPLELPAGEYTVTAGVLDKLSNKSGEYILNITIPEYNQKFALSKIQLANKIETKGDDSNFSLKNNIKIIPNASKTYTILNPMLYFYFEGYNLKLDENKKCNYTYNYYISDTEGKKVREYAPKTKAAGLSSIAEANGINVVALNNDAYYLNIRLIDNVSSDSIFIRKKFFVNKPVRSKTEADIAAKIEGYEEYSALTKEELEKEFKIVKYIAVSEEIDIFEKITQEEGMKRFLSEFWKRRDINKNTPVNEYKQVYFENLQIANESFSTSFREGWRTDRGRVILVYGRPDEIERYPSSLDSQPYEIWHYYSLEGGVQFVFADLIGNGSYELLHSDFRNEMKDSNWRSRVEKISSRGGGMGFDNF